MAKLKGPLFSLGATGQVGKALVFFGWKGLNVVREFVVPANPNTTNQQTQRGYLTQAVLRIHQAQEASPALNATDVQAYALLASTVQVATTWFNQVVRQWVAQVIAGKTGIIWRVSTITPGANTISFALNATHANPTTVICRYGTSKTALNNSVTAAEAPASTWTASIVGLTPGTKYYFQMRGTAPAGVIGANSGIYYGVAA